MMMAMLAKIGLFAALVLSLVFFFCLVLFSFVLFLFLWLILLMEEVGQKLNEKKGKKITKRRN